MLEPLRHFVTPPLSEEAKIGEQKNIELKLLNVFFEMQDKLNTQTFKELVLENLSCYYCLHFVSQSL